MVLVFISLTTYLVMCILIYFFSELASTQAMEELLELAETQAKEIIRIEKSFPSFLLPSGDARSIPHFIRNVEITEFEKLPQSTRGRLQYQQLNEAIRAFNELYATKQKNLELSKKKKTKAALVLAEEYNRLRVAEHGSRIFLTETEIRASKIFKVKIISFKFFIYFFCA